MNTTWSSRSINPELVKGLVELASEERHNWDSWGNGFEWVTLMNAGQLPDAAALLAKHEARLCTVTALNKQLAEPVTTLAYHFDVHGYTVTVTVPLDPAEPLRSVGLGERLNNFPAQLSGGEQQRVSIARALAKNPKLLLCDEPTGALDYKTGKQVLALLQDTCRRTGRTVIVITHNTALTGMADRIIQVRSGQIVSNQVNEHPVPVQEIEW